MENEIWLPVVGYEGLYEVSSLGRVKSLDRRLPHIYNKLLKGRIMALTPNVKREYVYIILTDSKRSNFLVHRLVAFAFVPNPKSLPHVNHINGVKWDNRAINLEWTDRSGNIRHAIKTGLKRVRFGKEHHNFKVENTITIEIYKKHHEEKITRAQLVKDYGLSKATICNIVTKKGAFNDKNYSRYSGR